MEIEVGVGVGPIKFGMRPKEVVKAMGIEPTYEEWMGGNLNDSLYYSGLFVGFDEYDSNGPLATAKVVSFVMNPSNHISLQGIALSDLTVSKILTLEINNVKPEYDQYKNLAFRKVGLNFGINNVSNNFKELSMCHEYHS